MLFSDLNTSPPPLFSHVHHNKDKTLSLYGLKYGNIVPGFVTHMSTANGDDNDGGWLMEINVFKVLGVNHATLHSQSYYRAEQANALNSLLEEMKCHYQSLPHVSRNEMLSRGSYEEKLGGEIKK